MSPGVPDSPSNPKYAPGNQAQVEFLSFGLRADSHQPWIYSKLTFESATPCPPKISQPSYPCPGLLPVDTLHSVCRITYCSCAARELTSAASPWQAESRKDRMPRACYCPSWAVFSPDPTSSSLRCPASNSRKHDALQHEQVSPRSSQTTNSPQIPPPGHMRGLGGLDGRVAQDFEPWSAL